MSESIKLMSEKIKSLFNQKNILTDSFQIYEGASGRNNRNYIIKTAGQKFFVKEYFNHPDDFRDRLHSEWKFIGYAYQVAPNFVARPYCYDYACQLAVFDFIEGTSFHLDQVDWPEINQAVEFFLALNSFLPHKNAIGIPNASEACFSLSEHIEKIDCRIKQLAQVKSKSDEENMFKFLLKELTENWLTLKSELLQHPFFKKYNIIESNQRCLSPSDFGFHNAIKKNDGHIVFVDFEYAGWDDPAKMACDFFSQIEVPVPRKYFIDFLNQVMSVFPDSDLLIERAKLLKPLCMIKWCCIVLNVFLPHHLARRQFSNKDCNIQLLHQLQLKKAKNILEGCDERN